MERTPSPSRRLHTPPAPLHGAKHDTYEPFSPRRSSRVAAQRDQTQQPPSPTRSRPSRATRAVTPTTTRKNNARPNTIFQGLSPPSSPNSPRQLHSPRTTRRAHFHDNIDEPECDLVAPTPGRRFLSAIDSRAMLPTPAKTPRKRPLQSEESLQPTARVLFPSRPANIEEAMPTPHKNRKSKRDFLTLDSFEDHTEEQKIEIYTDSKERIPTADEDEDNPFVTPSRRRQPRSKAHSAPKARKAGTATDRMQEAVNRDEGMIYLFRGKRVYRKFDDVPAGHTSDEPEFSGDDLRNPAGHEARRPLTRSAIKPRLLFQEEIKQQRQRQMGPDDVDEEAVTDIEVPIATPSKRRVRHESPVKQQEITPPPIARPKREISFDSWSRVKSSTSDRSSNSSRAGKKRAGDPLSGGPEKRTRSEQSSA
ncbi:hypothetical protein BU24DRAFT_457505 [Aaosphaeria arxii CBS 175.79]|uniref:Uncharacterized protein n=1 Tax=Aaosphaeria arxii CBS 175.79 TaxID=1450172 RepID=A0A6A5Y890_9PLEO|nr:uncharacterized protein BU24DRAFT_457505 [Aaosphaeria arxii CBS 175.79]KAF2021526.1 hypothetical protein BU24DRAFT_457505 [Aaosphaeria arxii CBS 175.79]